VEAVFGGWKVKPLKTVFFMRKVNMKKVSVGIVFLLLSYCVSGQGLALKELEKFVEMDADAVGDVLMGKGWRFGGVEDSSGVKLFTWRTTWESVRYNRTSVIKERPGNNYQPEYYTGYRVNIIYTSTDYNLYLEVKNKLELRGYKKMKVDGEDDIMGALYETYKYKAVAGFTTDLSGVTNYFVAVANKDLYEVKSTE